MPKKQHTWTRAKAERELTKFARHLLVKRGLASYTISGYRRVVAKVLKDLNTVRPTHRQIEGYIEGLHKKKYSFSHIVNTSLAIERYSEYMKKPIRLGRPKKPRRIIPETLTEAEIAVMLAGCKNVRERAIIALTAYSGIRSKEVCSLRVRDIDLGNNAVRVLGGKGIKDRIICISGDCTNVLLRYLSEYPRDRSEYLFTALVSGGPYSGQALRKLLITVARRVGIEKRVYPHLLRHSLATNLISRGANLLTVKEQLGHAWIDSTMIYITSRFQRIMMEYQHFAPSYL